MRQYMSQAKMATFSSIADYPFNIVWRSDQIATSRIGRTAHSMGFSPWVKPDLSAAFNQVQAARKIGDTLNVVFPTCRLKENLSIRKWPILIQ